MKSVICVLALLVAVALAADSYDAPKKYDDYRGPAYGSYGRDYPAQYPSGYRGGRYYYGGKYGGKCANDGLYYRDEYSFVICSNSNSYVQPCAPGTRNSGHHNYAPGYYYGYSDFCDVNLVDYGYAAGYAGYQPYPVKDSYGKVDSYGKADSYGKVDSYSKGDSYGKVESYGKVDSYDKPSYETKEYGYEEKSYDNKDSYDKKEYSQYEKQTY